MLRLAALLAALATMVATVLLTVDERVNPWLGLEIAPGDKEA